MSRTHLFPSSQLQAMNSKIIKTRDNWEGRTLLGSAGVAHRFHTLGMRALRSLTRSKIVTVNCTGYVGTDPNTMR